MHKAAFHAPARLTLVVAACVLLGWAQSPGAPPPQTGRGGRGGRGGSVTAPPADAIESPDGTRTVWIAADGHSIWDATRASRNADWAAPDRLLTIRGSVHGIVYSPNGASIAFDNPRVTGNGASPNDHWGFVVVFDFATRRMYYVDPSFDTDTDPSWSSDGTEVSFTRAVAGMPDVRLTRPVVRSAFTPPPRAPEERFTVTQALSAPFVNPPVPSGDGRALAWISHETTARNLYFMRLGEPARRIASFGGDDGQELTELAVSQNGDAVAFVRGIGPNQQGDLPNPAATPDPPQQQVWIAGTQEGTCQFLALGSTPVFLPDGSRILWVAGGSVMGARLVWSQGRLVSIGAPEPFFAGSLAGMQVSPDGRYIAYQQGPAIGIYDVAARSAVVVPHPDASDQGAVWSPDSRHLVFRRQYAAGGAGRGGRGGGGGIFGNGSCGNYRYCPPVVSDHPWSIWEVGVADLVPHQLWQADPSVVGSIYYPLDQSLSPGQHNDEMFWSADGRIAFAWERDGWRHLYAIPASGGTAVLLTPGDGEVETAAITLDRKHLVYATNIGDLGRRHIAEVAFDGTPVRALTVGEESQWAPTPLAGDAVGYIQAGWTDPTAVIVRDAGGVTRAAGLPRVPATFPAAQFLKPQLVEFPATDGHTAYGYLLVPPKPNGCAIIFSHGGIRRQMLPGFHYLEFYTDLYEENQYLASRGCVVLSVEYRSSIMRGEAFRDAPGWGFAGNSEMLDFLGAAKFLTARKDVDPARLGIYGLSWGGYMTANALSQHSDIFKVGFDMAGVHDSSNQAGYPYSAIAHLDTWTSPVFLAQGDDDRNVTFVEGITLARALASQHPNVELVTRVFPGETHEMALTYAHLSDLYTQGAAFLLQHLGVR